MNVKTLIKNLQIFSDMDIHNEEAMILIKCEENNIYNIDNGGIIGSYENNNLSFILSCNKNSIPVCEWVEKNIQ